MTKTLTGTITSWNRAAERLFGYTATEAIGQLMTLILPTELHQEEADILLQLRQGQHIQHYETIRLSKAGTPVEVSLSISPVTDREGTIIGVATIVRDIRERRDLERRKDEFIGAASHELKTPLTMLKAFAQLLPRQLESGGAQGVAPMLVRMEAQVDRLTRLIDELLDVSKMQAGQLDYEELPVDLDALVEETVALLQPTCTTHMLRVTGATNAIVVGDRDRLGQVVTNLITNAVKYSPGASMVDIVLAASQQAITISVHDYGVGIPPDQQPHIFERFYRVKAQQEQIVPGLGMGLYIAAEIIKRHGGAISVESEEGQGSTFLVSLPLK